ncbi:hypothetical protein K1719_000917 [Acacia pycnantha]|nr:hypothetical protein K1719_000917 [Acacia pycnantha]
MCTKEMSIGRASQVGFPNIDIMDCEGYSGGIWCLWDHSIASISLLECHHQFIHLQVARVAGSIWMLIVVYASPFSASRWILWDNLSCLAPSIQGAWLIGVTSMVRCYFVKVPLLPCFGALLTVTSPLGLICMI